MSGGGGVPAGYERARVRRAEIVALPELVSPLRGILARTTLHEFASAHPEARAMAGRGPVHAIPFGEDGRIVVRHVRHGGAMASVTRDLFLMPRAAAELAITLQLAARGVPTPQIVAYVLYRAGIFQRSVVATREIARASVRAGALLARP